VSKKFGEWYQKTKDKRRYKLTTLAFKLILSFTTHCGQPPNSNFTVGEFVLLGRFPKGQMPQSKI
jgi:hypothetical protein